MGQESLGLHFGRCLLVIMDMIEEVVVTFGGEAMGSDSSVRSQYRGQCLISGRTFYSHTIQIFVRYPGIHGGEKPGKKSVFIVELKKHNLPRLFFVFPATMKPM